MKKEDAVYWLILAIIILILYFVFSDGQFSLIFTLAGTVQTFGFALVVIKIRKSRSVTGLSRETFICYTLIFAIRWQRDEASESAKKEADVERDDAELAAYNAFLRGLRQQPRPSTVEPRPAGEDD